MRDEFEPMQLGYKQFAKDRRTYDWHCYPSDELVKVRSTDRDHLALGEKVTSIL